MQFGFANRFGDVVVHAGSQTPFAVSFHCPGRHRHNRDVPPGAVFEFANLLCRFESVEFRHLHVHENDVERFALPAFDRLFSVDGDFNVVAPFLQQSDGEDLIRLAVFRQQNPQGRKRGQRRDWLVAFADLLGRRTLSDRFG